MRKPTLGKCVGVRHQREGDEPDHKRNDRTPINRGKKAIQILQHKNADRGEDKQGGEAHSANSHNRPSKALTIPTLRQGWYKLHGCAVESEGQQPLSGGQKRKKHRISRILTGLQRLRDHDLECEGENEIDELEPSISL